MKGVFFLERSWGWRGDDLPLVMGKMRSLGFLLCSHPFLVPPALSVSWQSVRSPIRRDSRQESNTEKLHQVQVLENNSRFVFAVSFTTKAGERSG